MLEIILSNFQRCPVPLKDDRDKMLRKVEDEEGGTDAPRVLLCVHGI